MTTYHKNSQNLTEYISASITLICWFCSIFPKNYVFLYLKKFFESYSTYRSMLKEIILLIVTYYHNE